MYTHYVHMHVYTIYGAWALTVYDVCVWQLKG